MNTDDLDPRCLIADALRTPEDHRLVPVSPYRGGQP
jgi:hypothetical protein